MITPRRVEPSRGRLSTGVSRVKQVAATVENHASGLEEAAPVETVSIGGVLSKLISS